MKKVALSLAVVILAGCSAQQTTPEAQTQEQQMGEFEKLSQAVAAGEAVKCVMTDTVNGKTINYLMKAGKIKMANMPIGETAETASMLMDKEYIYNWSDQKKEGTKMKVPEEVTASPATETSQEVYTEQGRSVPDLSNQEQREAYENQGYTIDCDKADLADSEFMPPADVTFMDMSKMMENAAQMQQGQGMSPEQKAEFEKMMKQYAQ